MRGLTMIFGLVLVLAAGGYVLAPHFYHGLLDEEVRGIRPASKVQQNAVRMNLPHGTGFDEAFTIRSDVHDNAGIVAVRLSGRYQGQVGVWLLPGTSRGPTTVRSANNVARQITPDLRHENFRSERTQRLVRYMQRQ